MGSNQNEMRDNLSTTLERLSYGRVALLEEEEWSRSVTVEKEEGFDLVSLLTFTSRCRLLPIPFRPTLLPSRMT